MNDSPEKMNPKKSPGFFYAVASGFSAHFSVVAPPFRAYPRPSFLFFNHKESDYGTPA
jgi:hypothetical protein